ncbi:MAG: hypothetical protein M3R10_03405 [Verrucomicrobiota bacterium]|nr:hypothetical protein [Verrucomicrobiota bacterium]
MKLLLAVLIIAAAVPVLRAQEAKQMTVDQLVEKNVEAKGGAEALRALQTVKLTGKMLVNEGQMQLGFSQTKKRPDAVRNEITLQGMTAVQAYDGKDGWKIMPFQGRKDPEKMSADDLKSLMEDAEVDGPLVDWKEKGSTVEYLGTEDVDGTQAYKLKVTRKNGDVDFVYLDPDHFLEIRILSQRMEHGAQVVVETDLSDYEKVNGVFLPTSMESGRKGDPDKQKIIIDKEEGNAPVDDALFKFPTPAAK